MNKWFSNSCHVYNIWNAAVVGNWRTRLKEILSHDTRFERKNANLISCKWIGSNILHLELKSVGLIEILRNKLKWKKWIYSMDFEWILQIVIGINNNRWSSSNEIRSSFGWKWEAESIFRVLMTIDRPSSTKEFFWRSATVIASLETDSEPWTLHLDPPPVIPTVRTCEGISHSRSEARPIFTTFAVKSPFN